ncbi:unnamed protein product [Dracunculus medinensis]|uniref:MATH domain-containing protein n=1 Tax=Dracunculus medinensis TaxID=318479 RepID=A0A0N4UEC9_DRAME|nr:unnamed protein product [Dracunculus medinensis]
MAKETDLKIYFICEIMVKYSTDDSEEFYNERFVWDWPFCEDRLAKCFLTKEKFFACLPFSSGGTGESRGSTKKFENFSSSNTSWSIGLCNDGEFGTYFWRIEIEIMPRLNMLILNAWRDVTRSNDKGKRLRRIRKVYRLPYHYDVSTLKTYNYDWAFCIEASRKVDARNRPIPIKRSASIF